MPKVKEKLKLTQTLVKGLEPVPGKQIDVMDSELSGFAVRVSHGGTKTFMVFKTVNGIKRRFTLGRFPVMKTEEARAKAFQILADLANGKGPTKKAKAVVGTILDAFEHYIQIGRTPNKDGKTRIRESTEMQYRFVFRRLSALYKHKPFSITPEMVLQRHGEIAADNGAYAANHTMGLLRRIIDHAAIESDTEVKNPVDILTKAKRWCRETPRGGVLPAEDFSRFFAILKELPGDTVSDLYTMLLFTGLRKGEAMSLTWDRLDLDKKTLFIPEAETKNGQPLTLPVCQHLADRLKPRRDTWRNHGPVFPTQSRVGHVTNTAQYDRIFKEKGLYVYPHMLRATFTTIAAGLCSQSYVDALTNHVPQGVTAKHYVFPSAEQLRPTVELVAAEILRQAGGQ